MGHASSQTLRTAKYETMNYYINNNFTSQYNKYNNILLCYYFDFWV